MRLLTREFFTRPTLTVAPELLGKVLHSQTAQYSQFALITEVEAYTGPSDLASHAAKGRTKRNASMFLVGGHLYIYLIYGIHYCMNIVTDQEDVAGAVLVRAVRLVSQHPEITPALDLAEHLSHTDTCIIGPARVCRQLQLKTIDDGLDIVTSGRLQLFDTGINPIRYETGSRVGISKQTDLQWRFTIDCKDL